MKYWHSDCPGFLGNSSTFVCNWRVELSACFVWSFIPEAEGACICLSEGKMGLVRPCSRYKWSSIRIDRHFNEIQHIYITTIHYYVTKKSSMNITKYDREKKKKRAMMHSNSYINIKILNNTWQNKRLVLDDLKIATSHWQAYFLDLWH